MKPCDSGGGRSEEKNLTQRRSFAKKKKKKRTKETTNNRKKQAIPPSPVGRLWLSTACRLEGDHADVVIYVSVLVPAALCHLGRR